MSSVPALFASITKSSPPKPFAMPTIAPRTAKASQPPPTRGPLAGKGLSAEEHEPTEVTAAPRPLEDQQASPALPAPAARPHETGEEKTDAAPIIDSISSGGAVAGEVAPRVAEKSESPGRPTPALPSAVARPPAASRSSAPSLPPAASRSSAPSLPAPASDISFPGHRAESPKESHSTSGEHAVAAPREPSEHATIGSTTALTRAAVDGRKRWIVGGAIALGALITAVALAAAGRDSSGPPRAPAPLSSATFPGANRSDAIALAPEVRAAAAPEPPQADAETTDATGPTEPEAQTEAQTEAQPTVAEPAQVEDPETDERPRDGSRRKRDQDKRDQDKRDQDKQDERDVRKPDLDVEATFKTGQTAFLRGDAKGALSTFRKVLAASPGFAPAWRGAALAHEKLGQKSAAAKALRKYLKLAPGASDAAQIRARLERLE